MYYLYVLLLAEMFKHYNLLQSAGSVVAVMKRSSRMNRSIFVTPNEQLNMQNAECSGYIDLLASSVIQNNPNWAGNWISV